MLVAGGVDLRLRPDGGPQTETEKKCEIEIGKTNKMLEKQLYHDLSDVFCIVKMVGWQDLSFSKWAEQHWTPHLAASRDFDMDANHLQGPLKDLKIAPSQVMRKPVKEITGVTGALIAWRMVKVVRLSRESVEIAESLVRHVEIC